MRGTPITGLRLESELRLCQIAELSGDFDIGKLRLG
jgi:hypothetical protein